MSAEQPVLRVELLGKLRVSAGEQAMDRFETRRTALLLARLALPPHRDWPREELIELLWPDEDPVATRTRFRQTLASLRRALEAIGTTDAELDEVLRASRASVGLDLTRVACDVLELEACLRRASADPQQQRTVLDQALGLYEHHLLPGFYETWVLSERERLEGSLRNALVRLSQSLATSEPEAALEYARRAVGLDPLSEVAHEQVLRLLVQIGRTAEATRHWKEIERLFWKELRAYPPESLKAILSQPTPEPVRPTRPSSEPTAAPTPLPLPLDRFFGRHEEREALLETLRHPTRVRLTTVLGPPGVGKTRLALEVAAQLQQEQPERYLLFVGLETVETGEAALSRVLEVASGVSDKGGTATALAHLLASQRQPVLILDNAESARGLANALRPLLQSAPQLTCLVTSQQPLGLAGEQEFPLPPLGTAAVELFLDRARRVRPNLSLTPKDQVEIDQLCQKLDGLPLALELAASWLSVFTPEQVATRLERDYGLLVRRGSGDTRHASLQSALEGSLSRLTEAQQALLGQLAIFRGGWTLEAAEQVCQDLSPLVLLELEALRATSLVSTYTLPSGELRFRMLETIRVSVEKGLTQEQRDAAQRRHVAYFCAHAERAACLYDSREHLSWFDLLVQERENLLAALGYAATLPPAWGSRLAVALWRFWERQGKHLEAIQTLERFLHLLPESEPLQRARALEAIGRLQLSQRRFARAASAFETSAQQYEALGEQAASALVRCFLAGARRDANPDGDLSAYLDQCIENQQLLEQIGSLPQKAMAAGQRGAFHAQLREYSEARQHLERSMTLYRIIGNQRGMIWCLHLLGYAEGHRNQLEAALSFYNEGLQLAEQAGEDHARVRLLWNTVDALIRQEAFAMAEQRCREAIALTSSHGMRADGSIFLAELGRAMAYQNRPQEARAWFREGLRLADAADAIPTLLHCMRWLVRLSLEEALAQEGRAPWRQAAHLWGSLLRLETLLEPGQVYDFDTPIDTALEQLRARLGTEFDQECARTTHYTRAEAVQMPLLYPEHEVSSEVVR